MPRSERRFFVSDLLGSCGSRPGLRLGAVGRTSHCGLRCIKLGPLWCLRLTEPSSVRAHSRRGATTLT